MLKNFYKFAYHAKEHNREEIRYALFDSRETYLKCINEWDSTTRKYSILPIDFVIDDKIKFTGCIWSKKQKINSFKFYEQYKNKINIIKKEEDHIIGAL